MNNILTPPKQPAQQEAPMHRAAPAGANLTNARTGGMVAPRGYAGGTADVPPSSAPVVPAGQDVPTIQPLPAGRGFGAGGVGAADFHAANTFAPAPGPQVFAAPDPLAHMAGRGLPFNYQEARAHVDAAVAPAGMPAPPNNIDMRYANNGQAAALQAAGKPFVEQIGGEFAPYDPGYIPHAVYAPGAVGAPVGSPEHAVANPHAYDSGGFHAATGHLSLYQLGLMSQIAEQRARIGQMQAVGQHAAMTKELVELGSQQHVSPAEAQRMGMLREGLGLSMKTTMPIEYDENGNVKQ